MTFDPGSSLVMIVCFFYIKGGHMTSKPVGGQLCTTSLWPSVLSLTAEHVDSSPYGGVYLSPPLDNNWRR